MCTKWPRKGQIKGQGHGVKGLGKKLRSSDLAQILHVNWPWPTEYMYRFWGESIKGQGHGERSSSNFYNGKSHLNHSKWYIFNVSFRISFKRGTMVEGHKTYDRMKLHSMTVKVKVDFHFAKCVAYGLSFDCLFGCLDSTIRNLQVIAYAF